MWRRRRRRVTPEQVLSSRPLRNDLLEAEELEDGGLRVLQERRSEWWARVLSVVFPLPRRRLIELDAIGAQVWRLSDGSRTLRQMIEVFVREHKLTRVEAEWSLRTYLRDLGKRGLIGFAVEEREGSKGDKSHGRSS